jgi:hypothetical protein
MTSTAKSERLRHLSATLEEFDANYRGQFLCPTCLETILLQDSSHITRAHILPRAAEGNVTTWLCSSCNSRFGQGRDRWLGEYLQYLNAGSLFDPGISKGQIRIEGIPVQGSLRHTPKGIDIFISPARSSPAAIEQVKEEFRRLRPTRKVSIGIPLLSKKPELNLGFTTAAYLYGFSLFGYSWVLQHHFKGLRDYIMMREAPSTLPVHITRTRDNPDKTTVWSGIVAMDGDYIPCVGIMGTIVCFPPFYDPSRLRLVRDPKGTFRVQIYKVRGIPPYNYTGPYALVVGDKPVIYPDAGLRNAMIGFVVYIDPDSFQAIVLDRFVDLSRVDPQSISKRIRVKIESRQSGD